MISLYSRLTLAKRFKELLDSRNYFREVRHDCDNASRFGLCMLLADMGGLLGEW